MSLPRNELGVFLFDFVKRTTKLIPGKWYNYWQRKLVIYDSTQITVIRGYEQQTMVTIINWE